MKKRVPFMGKMFDIVEKGRMEVNGKTPYDNDVEIKNDVVFKTVDGENLYMDIYIPKQRSQSPTPAVYVIPGGGWMIKNRTRRKGYAMLLARAGAVVFVTDYRVTPQIRFPANLEDVIDGFDYIYDNKDVYNVDVNNVMVTGDSAGGHLSACLACSATTEGYVEKLKLKKPKITPVGCAFISGAFSFDAMDARIPCTHTFITYPFSGFRTKTAFRKWEYHKEAHPWDCITEKFPPSYNSGGKMDAFCKNDAITMAKKLSEKGVENEYLVGQYRKDDHCYVYRLPYKWARVDMYKIIEWYVRLEQKLGVDLSDNLKVLGEFLLN